MKLLIVTQTVDPAHPVLGFFVEWLQEIRQHQHVESLHVISLSQAATDVRLDGISITHVGHPNKWIRLLKFWHAIIKDPSDTVLVHMTPPWLIAGWPVWAIKRVRTALWYTHGSVTTALRMAVRHADVTLTATKDAFPFPHPRVKAIGHGIADTFGPHTRPERPSDRFAMLGVGRISPRKRVMETITLFDCIHKMEPRATLDWIGPVLDADQEYFKDTRQEIEKRGLTDAVRFLPSAPASDMPEGYASHDLLLHLSDTGSLDKVVIEALASGCPVFSTNPATVEGMGKQWGWQGDLDDGAAAEALQRLIQGVSPEERRGIGYVFALRPFIDRMVRELLSR